MPITTTPSGGPQGEFSTYTPIYAQTLSATTASITFSNIPTTFTDLILVVNAASETTHAFLNMQFNGDTGSNYSYTELLGNGTNATSTRYTNATQMFNANVAMQQTTISFNGIYQIMNYSNATTNKTGLARFNCINSDYNGTIAVAGTWRNTSPITSIKVFPSRSGTPYNFSIGSTFTLYGIKAAATQFIPTKAVGGDVVASDGTYAYHAFVNTGTFKPAQALTCDVLVVSGGGSAGYSSYGQGGGGGAGGISYNASQSFSSASTYTMTVGAGGAAPSGNGNQGNTSSCIGGALSFSVVGGGGGGGGSASATGTAGGNGACGGGSQGNNTTGGTGSVGFNGGSASSDSNRFASGGGGGMGAAGGNGTGGGAPATAGAGGNGVSTYSSWGSAVGFGHGISGTYWFAGGGGGGADNNGAGGNGGGGTNGLPGMFATGGGGGSKTGGATGAGGSGIVIVRYAL